jgi:hypothetical protein
MSLCPRMIKNCIGKQLVITAISCYWAFKFRVAIPACLDARSTLRIALEDRILSICLVRRHFGNPKAGRCLGSAPPSLRQGRLRTSSGSPDRPSATLHMARRAPQQSSWRRIRFHASSIDFRQPLRPALALLTVARPLANPTPLPLVPRLLNIGAFLSISGTIKKRTWLPRM